MQQRPFTIVFLVSALAGFFFATYSSADFIQHLDRQVHGIHCSFIPGLTTADMTGSSGCHVTMMSPYSSVFRQVVWGGIPVSLAAMSVFAFLLYRGLDLYLNQRHNERGTTFFLFLASLLPLLSSLIMGYISLVELGAACKLCIGIYTSSLGVFVGGLGAWRQAMADEATEEGQELSGHIGGFALGVIFVVTPMLAYMGLLPDYEKYVGVCGALPKPEDKYGILIPLDNNKAGLATIEVFDPLCPACKGFESRLTASGLEEKMSRKAVMFPLDSTCNWMVGTSLHAGACSISEAVLCAAETGSVDKVNSVIDWSFTHQEEIRKAAEARPEAAADMAELAFPDLKSCIGSAKIKQKLNQSLRWAVNNQIPVLTPQIYVNNQKLCDEDTDLGMDFALSRLIEKAGGGQ